MNSFNDSESKAQNALCACISHCSRTLKKQNGQAKITVFFVSVFLLLVIPTFMYWPELSVFMRETTPHTTEVHINNTIAPTAIQKTLAARHQEQEPTPPPTTAPDLSTDISNMVIIRNIGLAYAALLGLIFTFWRTLNLSKQAHIAEQNLITDRFIKATEQLGSDIETVRIGAIYSLWRIAVDSTSERDKTAVLDSLSAFVRSSGKKKEPPKSEETDAQRNHKYNIFNASPKTSTEKETIRNDIQITMNLFAHRMHELNYAKPYTLDLHGAMLAGAQLSQVKFLQNITLNLSKANFREANLVGIYFRKVDLSEANLTEANLREANLESTFLRKANLTGAQLDPATELWTRG